MADRYNEQIAEDVVFDLVDEVDLWALDGGKWTAVMGVAGQAPTVLGPVDPAAIDSGAVVVAQAGGRARRRGRSRSWFRRRNELRRGSLIEE